MERDLKESERRRWENPNPNRNPEKGVLENKEAKREKERERVKTVCGYDKG